MAMHVHRGCGIVKAKPKSQATVRQEDDYRRESSYMKG
jgi:hypothetical protein